MIIFHGPLVYGDKATAHSHVWLGAQLLWALLAALRAEGPCVDPPAAPR